MRRSCLPTSIHIAGVAVGCMGCRNSRGGSESCIQSVCFSLLRDFEPSCCRVYPVQCTYSVAAVPTLLSTPTTAPPLRRPAACVAKPRTDLHACRGPRMNKCSRRRPHGFASTGCHACCRRGLVCMSMWTVHKQDPNVQHRAERRVLGIVKLTVECSPVHLDQRTGGGMC